MRRFRILIIAVMLLCAESLASAAQVHRSHPGTKVICIKSYSPPTGAYQYKPTKCVLHHRGSPFVNLSLVDLSNMHWRRWQGGSAVGKGTTVENTVGKSKIRIKLSKTRNRCGTPVFTKASFRVTSHYQGETYYSRGSMPIDDCLR